MNPKKRTGYVSTGQAAKFLGIFALTVLRYVDKGILSGGTNPITNRRSVTRESILALMKRYNIKWEE